MVEMHVGCLCAYGYKLGVAWYGLNLAWVREQWRKPGIFAQVSKFHPSNRIKNSLRFLLSERIRNSLKFLLELSLRRRVPVLSKSNLAQARRSRLSEKSQKPHCSTA